LEGNENWKGPVIVSAIYSPPKHAIDKDEYLNYFSSLGHRFIVGGDYNAKHLYSRTILPKGRQLLLAIEIIKLDVH